MNGIDSDTGERLDGSCAIAVEDTEAQDEVHLGRSFGSCSGFPDWDLRDSERIGSPTPDAMSLLGQTVEGVRKGLSESSGTIAELRGEMVRVWDQLADLKSSTETSAKVLSQVAGVFERTDILAACKTNASLTEEMVRLKAMQQEVLTAMEDSWKCDNVKLLASEVRRDLDKMMAICQRCEAQGSRQEEVRKLSERNTESIESDRRILARIDMEVIDLAGKCKASQASAAELRADFNSLSMAVGKQEVREEQARGSGRDVGSEAGDRGLDEAGRQEVRAMVRQELDVHYGFIEELRASVGDLRAGLDWLASSCRSGEEAIAESITTLRDLVFERPQVVHEDEPPQPDCSDPLTKLQHDLTKASKAFMQSQAFWEGPPPALGQLPGGLLEEDEGEAGCDGRMGRRPSVGDHGLGPMGPGVDRICKRIEVCLNRTSGGARPMTPGPSPGSSLSVGPALVSGGACSPRGSHASASAPTGMLSQKPGLPELEEVTHQSRLLPDGEGKREGRRSFGYPSQSFGVFRRQSGDLRLGRGKPAGHARSVQNLPPREGARRQRSLGELHQSPRPSSVTCRPHLRRSLTPPQSPECAAPEFGAQSRSPLPSARSPQPSVQLQRMSSEGAGPVRRVSTAYGPPCPEGGAAPVRKATAYGPCARVQTPPVVPAAYGPCSGGGSLQVPFFTPPVLTVPTSPVFSRAQDSGF